MHLPFWKKALSYLAPIRLRTGSSPVNPLLELFLFQGRYQLATEDALYSDGAKYRPLLAGFGTVRHSLAGLRSVLVLGAGLGSAVNVLERFGARPQITLVELDEVVARWAHELMPQAAKQRVRIVVEDAEAFVHADSQSYDAVVVDVFNNREALSFTTKTRFLQNCRSRLNDGGIFLLNYMLNPDSPSWEKTYARIESVFPGSRVLELGPNRVIVAML